jgi:hypothetical protein
MPDDDAITVWMPISPERLRLIRQDGMRALPPSEQPMFYPVLSEEYAQRMARDWNILSSGVGYVARIRVRAEFLNRYEAHSVGGSGHPEYRIPAADLEAFNAAILGQIEIVAEFHRKPPVTGSGEGTGNN